MGCFREIFLCLIWEKVTCTDAPKVRVSTIFSIRIQMPTTNSVPLVSYMIDFTRASYSGGPEFKS